MTTHLSMSHADAAWLRMDSPTNLMVINSVLFFAQAPDWELLRTSYAARIVERHPRFRCVGPCLRGASGVAHWEEDPSFDASRSLPPCRAPRAG